MNADPRVKISSEDFSAQFALSRRLAAALDGSSADLLEARSIRSQLKEVGARAAANLRTPIQSLDTHIAALLESNDAPKRGLERLNGDVATLYAQVANVDAAPTAAQIGETERALEQWAALRAAWLGLRNGEMAELNRALSKARLPHLREDLEPPRNLDFADED